MFKQMTVGKKITTGFAAILAILTVLGVIASTIMVMSRNNASDLATAYMPQVELTTSIERNIRRIMYDTRGYAFTRDEEFLKKTEEPLKRLETRFTDFDKLIKEQAALSNMREPFEKVKKSMEQYKADFERTKVLVAELTKTLEEAGKLGTKYLGNLSEFVAHQEEKLDRELRTSASTRKIQERSEKLGLAHKLTDLGALIRLSVARSIMNNDVKIMEEGMEHFQEVNAIFKKLMGITYVEEDKAVLRDVEKIAKAYHDGALVLMKVVKELDVINVNRTKTGTEATNLAEELSKSGLEDAQKLSNGTSTVTGTGTGIIVIGLIAAMTFGIFLSIGISRGITEPLRKAIRAVTEASEQIGSASGEVSTASQRLAEASNQQASSIEETSASLEELTGMVNNNVDNAEKAAEIAAQVKDVSGKGNEAMHELVKSMETILASNDQIQALVKVIAEIGDKTAIIDEIVFQTKLLSFNASVEAERAGEHGRGFAVVAQEVGNLAQMSGKAALEISTIVKESVRNAEAITDENKKKVEAGNKLVSEIAIKLKDIYESAKSVSENAAHILTASKDQASGITQINTAMGQLDKVTQENASTSEETASSSEQLSAQAEGLNSVVEELVGMIEEDSASALKGGNNKKFVASSKHTVKSKMAKNEAQTSGPLKKSVGNDKSGHSWEEL